MTVATYQHAVCAALCDYSTATQTKVIRAYYSGLTIAQAIFTLR